jgi:hypothetical protein
MAKRQVVSYSYTCDVCGGAIPESDGESANRKLTWEGSDYVVDVCATHGSELGELLTQLKEFVDAGSRPGAGRGRKAAAASAPALSSRAPRSGRRASASKSPAAKAAGKATGSRKASGPAPTRGEVAAIRIWARENGHTVNERGRIPGPVLAAYQAATGGGSAPAAASPTPAKRRGRPRKVVAS